MSEEKDTKKEVNIGCGCLTDIIALLLLIIILDLLGCDWCHGFTDKLKNVCRTDNQVQQVHPNECR